MEFAGEVVGLGRAPSRFAARRPGHGPSPAAAARPSWWWCPRPPCCRSPTGVPFGPGRRVSRGLLTAHDALFTQARLSAGERVLISGAAGGVGTAAVQLAHAAGAHVVASVRTPTFHDAGPRRSVPTRWSSPTRSATHGPYDVSLELVGAPGVAPCSRRLRPAGGWW